MRRMKHSVPGCLNPLARWAEAAYGDRAFDDAAKGYAKYCLGVWKSQQLYEKTGRYTPEKIARRSSRKSMKTKATWFPTCGPRF